MDLSQAFLPLKSGSMFVASYYKGKGMAGPTFQMFDITEEEFILGSRKNGSKWHVYNNFNSRVKNQMQIAHIKYKRREKCYLCNSGPTEKLRVFIEDPVPKSKDPTISLKYYDSQSLPKIFRSCSRYTLRSSRVFKEYIEDHFNTIIANEDGKVCFAFCKRYIDEYWIYVSSPLSIFQGFCIANILCDARNKNQKIF